MLTILFKHVKNTVSTHHIHFYMFAQNQSKNKHKRINFLPNFKFQKNKLLSQNFQRILTYKMNKKMIIDRKFM
jgi:hypothetical protein